MGFGGERMGLVNQGRGGGGGGVREFELISELGTVFRFLFLE